MKPNPLHISLWALLVLGGSRTYVLRGSIVCTRLHFCVSSLQSDGGRRNFGWDREIDWYIFFCGLFCFFFREGEGRGLVGVNFLAWGRFEGLSPPCKYVFSEAFWGRDSCSFCTQVLVNSLKITTGLLS